MYYLWLILLLLTTFIMKPTNCLSQNYIPPVDIKMFLSGTFGELRSNHFHSGIDIKTQGKIGEEIYAIADGYVSRIKISSYGYGKAIYIDHNNGHTSVYAHLESFPDKIDKIIKKEHYKKEQFEINFYPKKNELLVKQGEIIGFSGNSGSSSGPHLHFEIRETISQHPINPLLLGYNIEDDIAPTLNKVKIYSLTEGKLNYNDEQIFNIKKINNIHTITDTPEVVGEFALAISTYDRLNNANNKNGVYAIKMYIDSIIIYDFKVDELDFKTNRYINAHIDYKEKQENSIKYHRCFKLPNNKLTNYNYLDNNGIIRFADDKKHIVKIEVTDIAGNISILQFYIKSNTSKNIKKTTNNATKEFSYSTPNMFKEEGFELHMQTHSLYQDVPFEYQVKDSIANIYGKLHQCHFEYEPVHKKYIISIKSEVPEQLKEKAYLAKMSKRNTFKYIGGRWQNGFLRGKVREFGNFCVVTDTINPTIKALNIIDEKDISNQETIKCVIKDKESGIKSYRGEINGEWILMEYDHKRNLLKYKIDENLKQGRHIFNLEIIDNVGNKTDYQANFTYSPSLQD